MTFKFICYGANEYALSLLSLILLVSRGRALPHVSTKLDLIVGHVKFKIFEYEPLRMQKWELRNNVCTRMNTKRIRNLCRLAVVFCCIPDTSLSSLLV